MSFWVRELEVSGPSDWDTGKSEVRKWSGRAQWLVGAEFTEIGLFGLGDWVKWSWYKVCNFYALLAFKFLLHFILQQPRWKRWWNGPVLLFVK